MAIWRDSQGNSYDTGNNDPINPVAMLNALKTGGVTDISANPQATANTIKNNYMPVAIAPVITPVSAPIAVTPTPVSAIPITASDTNHPIDLINPGNSLPNVTPPPVSTMSDIGTKINAFGVDLSNPWIIAVGSGIVLVALTYFMKGRK